MTQRIVDLSDGVAVIVTDLHGDQAAYEAYRDRFLSLHQQGAADRFILCGDLIHGYGKPEEDRSLDMLLDVMRLQDEMGEQTVIMLLGNHELPHLYGFTLSRGNTHYTPGFEAQLTRAGSAVRARVLAFLDGLPFVVRTGAGVMLSHCGAAPLASLPGNRERLATFSHAALIERVDRALAEQPREDLVSAYERTTGYTYDEAVRYFLAVTGRKDPRYDHLLRTLILNRNDALFELLWDTFFTRNEQGIGEHSYGLVLEQYLRTWSAEAPAPQVILVSGHIPVRGGYQVIAKRQLRMASYAHANPRAAGIYLQLDCAEPVQTPEMLLPHLDSVFV